MGAGLQRAAAAAKATRQKPKPYRTQRYGILNPYGDIWSPDTFNSIGAAEEHIKSFWAKQPDKDLSKFKVVVVKVTVTAVE